MTIRGAALAVLLAAMTATACEVEVKQGDENR